MIFWSIEVTVISVNVGPIHCVLLMEPLSLCCHFSSFVFCCVLVASEQISGQNGLPVKSGRSPLQTLQENDLVRIFFSWNHGNVVD